MKAYRKEIINNAVSYIAQKYYESRNRYITQTLLFKILALLDFRCLRKNGRPCVEFSYSARKLGPVPEELYHGDLSLYDSFTTKDKKYKDRNNNEKKQPITSLQKSQTWIIFLPPKKKFWPTC